MESEKAKAKAGKLYDANNDIELVSEREACKEVCYELNSLRPSQTVSYTHLTLPTKA